MVDEYRVNDGEGSWVKMENELKKGIYMIKVNGVRNLRMIVVLE